MQNVSRKELEKLKKRSEKGQESETPGLLEQWLKEGKISEEEAIAEAINSFAAGVDTVHTSINCWRIYHGLSYECIIFGGGLVILFFFVNCKIPLGGPINIEHRS